MLDRHDAHWIGLSQKGWQDEELARFLRTYRLVRGRAGKLVFANSSRANRAEFYRTCTDVFHENYDAVQDLASADQVWKLAVKATKMKFEDGLQLYSAVSKLMWFYFPNKWIMFDSQNRAALATWLKANKHITSKSKVTATTFTDGFRTFYEAEGREGASFAAGFFSRSYPYTPRVAEKYLWLMGLTEPSRALVLSSYRASLDIAPSQHSAR